MIECVQDIILKDVSSFHSNASARTIINENFDKISSALICIKELSIEDLEGIIFPDIPIVGANYLLHYDGDNYVLLQYFATPGTKYIFYAGESEYIPETHQKIVYEKLVIDGGTLECDGWLVIL